MKIWIEIHTSNHNLLMLSLLSCSFAYIRCHLNYSKWALDLLYHQDLDDCPPATTCRANPASWSSALLAPTFHAHLAAPDALNDSFSVWPPSWCLELRLGSVGMHRSACPSDPPESNSVWKTFCFQKLIQLFVIKITL